MLIATRPTKNYNQTREEKERMLSLFFSRSKPPALLDQRRTIDRVTITIISFSLIKKRTNRSKEKFHFYRFIYLETRQIILITFWAFSFKSSYILLRHHVRDRL